MIYLITLVIGIITLIFSVKFYFKRRYSFWSRQGVPGYEGIDFSEFGELSHEVSLKRAEKYGKIYGYYEFFRKGIVINEPQLIKDILVKDFHIFPHHRELYFGEDSINLNLFNLPGNDQWKRIRSIITPAFTSAKLKQMMYCIEDISDKFLENLSEIVDNNEGIELDIKRYVGAFLVDVIASCAYGIKTDSLQNPDQPMVTYANKIFAVEGGFSLIMAVILPKFAKFLRLEPFNGAAIRYFKELTKRIIKERNQNEASNNKRLDFIQLMIEANKENENSNIDNKNTSGESLSKDIKTNSNLTMSTIEMTAQSVLFLAVGYDTTGSTISHAFYYLSKYQSIQQKLYEEISTLDSYTNESLTSLKYLNGFLLETLRLSPPILKVERVSTEDYILGK